MKSVSGRGDSTCSWILLNAQFCLSWLPSLPPPFLPSFLPPSVLFSLGITFPNWPLLQAYVIARALEQFSVSMGSSLPGSFHPHRGWCPKGSPHPAISGCLLVTHRWREEYLWPRPGPQSLYPAVSPTHPASGADG